MNRFTLIILCSALSLATSSCLKEKRETTYNSQESKIDQYIESNRYKKTENGTDTLDVIYNGGSTRLVLTDGTGEGLQSGGTIAFYYAGYAFSGSKSNANLFVTNHEETATAANWTLTDSDYKMMTMILNGEDLMEGLRAGLTGVKSGEHCEILFSGKYGFGKKPFGIIPANSALLFEIWVEAVSNE